MHKRIFTGITIGIFTGILICLFRFFVNICDAILNSYILPLINSEHFFYKVIWGAGLIVLAVIVYMIIRFEPNAKGGGIPHSANEVTGTTDARWWSVLVSKLIAAPLCLLAGFSLGKTGSAIELGAMMGKGIGIRFRKWNIKRYEYIIFGTAAGLSALFNAPAAGILFTLEKLHRKLDQSLIPVIVSSLCAAAVSIFTFGYTPIVKILLPLFDWKLYICLAILGIFLGVLGYLYMESLSVFSKYLQDSKKLPTLPLWISLFLLAGIIGYFFPSITGGGTNMLALMTESTTLRTLLLLLVGKYLFSMLSSGSGLPGGSVFPLLTVGGCLGQIFGILFLQINPALPFTPTLFILPGMAGFFTSAFTLPLTGILLLCEFSCDYRNILPLFIVCLFSYLTKRIITHVTE